jgi:ribosome-associated protein
MFAITPRLSIPDGELHWTFVRSSGPGGQNVNKVASKAVLRWNLAANQTLSEDLKARLRIQQRNRITGDGDLVIASQRYRDQERNKEDAFEKLRNMILQASVIPRARRVSRPTRAARERRLETKRRRGEVKRARRPAFED